MGASLDRSTFDHFAVDFVDFSKKKKIINFEKELPLLLSRKSKKEKDLNFN